MEKLRLGNILELAVAMAQGTAPNLFGTLGGTGVANGAEILQQLDQQLNHGAPPSIELIFVEHHLEEAWYSNLGRCCAA